MKTLEQLLEMKVETRNGIKFTPDFRIAVQENKRGCTHIIIHPAGHNGDTLDFLVKGNALTPFPSVRRM